MKAPIGYRIFMGFNVTFLLLVCASTLFPFVFVIARSFASELEILERGIFFLPSRPTFEAYDYLLRGGSPILTGYINTIFITVFGTLFNMTLTTMLSYVISKKYLPGRNAVTFMVFFTMIFGGGLIPTFLVVRSTGLLNNIWSMVIPAAVSPWNALILRNFFQTVPDSLEESARLDGASDPVILLRIYLPLSLPAIATIGLFYAVANWNVWFSAAIYINDADKWPLQLVLREILNRVEMLDDFMRESFLESHKPASESVRAAATIVAVVPIMCVYPFIQKYFVKGVMVGSVKG